MEEEVKTNKKKIIIIMAAVIAVAVAAVVIMIVISFTGKPKELTADDHMKNAASFMEDKEYGKAISAYNMALEKNPELLDAYIGISKAYEAENNTQGVKETLIKAIDEIEDINWSDKEVPDTVKDIYYKYADILVADGDSVMAQSVLASGSDISEGLLDNYSNPDFKVHNDAPVRSGEKTVLFGMYPEKRVGAGELTKSITDAEYDDNGVAEVKGIKYFRTGEDGKYSYYIMNDITWRVVSEDKDKCVLMSEYAIDAVQFNDEYTDIDWNNSSLRNWLNKTFYDIAFNDEQKKDMISMSTASSRNPDYGFVSGGGVSDMVSIFSAEECSEGANGFAGDRKAADKDRLCRPTEFAADRGVYTDTEGYCKWWLRTCGVNMALEMFTNTTGVFACDGYYVIGTDIGVRPVITISEDSMVSE
ncbi:MAG: DUF6273 domain-containing protein [Lachnospiraceae bacterium]|nr:DUF6273 domain-containing protein [Lachnospiraceae bacterium]